MNEVVLEARLVKKSFRSPDGSEIGVLRGANLSMKKGSSVSLTGESGAGKTTFLNILAGMESATSGEVLWNGKSITGLSNSAQAKLRGKFMGFVFQNYCLIPELNAVQNVELASRIAGKFDSEAMKRARDLLSSVGLKNRMGHLPSQLSGGEKQRVAIARALVNLPSVVLADEPTGNLDENTARGVMDMLLRLCSDTGASLLLITHNPDFAARTDVKVRLSNGLAEEI